MSAADHMQAQPTSRQIAAAETTLADAGSPEGAPVLEHPGAEDLMTLHGHVWTLDCGWQIEWRVHPETQAGLPGTDGWLLVYEPQADGSTRIEIKAQMAARAAARWLMLWRTFDFLDPSVAGFKLRAAIMGFVMSADVPAGGAVVRDGGRDYRDFGRLDASRAASTASPSGPAAAQPKADAQSRLPASDEAGEDGAS